MKRRSQLWVVFFGLVTLTACTRSRPPEVHDGQTHWMRECRTGAECGVLECVCGVCAAPCDGESQCLDALGATAICVAASESGREARCGADAPMSGLCVPQCDVDADCKAIDARLACEGSVCHTSSAPLPMVDGSVPDASERHAVVDPHCFEDIDGSSAPSALALGPNNHVFAPAHVRPDAVLNYQDQRVFEGPVLGLTANFTGYQKLEFDPEEFARQQDALTVPEHLATLLEYVGEVRLTPAGCDGVSLDGKRVRVELFWKLDGAIVESMPQGVALGTVEEGALVTLPGAVVSGGDDAQRLLNGLQATVLDYAFDSANRDGPLYLRLWALSRDGVPSTLYVNRVDWD